MAMSSYTRAPLYPSADDCLADYSAITGYNPADPSTDNGAVIETVLAYAQKTGLSLGPAKHKIRAFASVNFADLDEVKRAINLFGGLDIGVNLPLSAQSATYVMDAESGPAAVAGSWGGHSVWAAGADDFGVDIISWGARYKATWAFWQAYVDEAHAILDPDFITGGFSPADVNWDELQQAMAAL